MLSIKRAGERLPSIGDFVFVIRELWLLLLLFLMSFWAFLFLPQGTDILIAFLETLSNRSGFVSIILLILAILFWSISSEFCTRFLIYMSDNSGHRLSSDRVNFRKRLQKYIAAGILYFPLILIVLAFGKAFYRYRPIWSKDGWIFIALEFILLGLIFILWIFYHSNFRIRSWNPFHLMHLSTGELKWTAKLYGIFNDYRVDLYPNHFYTYNLDLPREQELPGGSFIPKAFKLILGPIILNNSNKVSTWMYRIPLSYFKHLFKQGLILLSISIFLFCCILCANIHQLQNMGTLILMCLGFGIWQTLYTFLHVLDKAQPIRNIIIPYRLLFFFWICICSYFNKDHPISVLNSKNIYETKYASVHFRNWIKNLKSKEHILNEKKIPVFFIAAEGGALRTGTYTAYLLARLQDSFPQFKKHIYCYSGISGGTLGLQFFQSIPDEISTKLAYQNSVKHFFGNDFLSPVIGKLLYGEILNCIIPFPITAFDRAKALEKSWEIAWANSNSNSVNIFAANFNNQVADDKAVICINSVEAETGTPVIFSNIILDSNIALSEKRDLSKNYSFPISYSTAINLGTRFPLISPAAMIEMKNANHDRIRRHYIDGGYFENTGQTTLLQILQSIHPEQYPEMIPYIIQFNFSEDETKPASIRFANEWMEIIDGIKNTRFGRAALAMADSKKYLKEHFPNPHFIELNLEIPEKNLPMNWVLSATALNKIEEYTEKQIQLKQDSIPMLELMNAIKSIKP